MADAESSKPAEDAGQFKPAVSPRLHRDRQPEDEEYLSIDKENQNSVEFEKLTHGSHK